MRRSSAFLSALVIVAGFGCARNPETAVTTGPGVEEGEHHGSAPHGDVDLSDEAVRAAGIEVAAVRRMPFRADIAVPAVVESTPDGRALITPPLAGRVLSLLVAVGDRVVRGQAIAVIESVELAERASAVTEAERGVLAAKADVAKAASESTLAEGRLRTAKSALKRQRDLAVTGAFSQPSLQAAERELNEARSTLESAQKEAIVHRMQMERMERLFKEELVSRVELENARLDVEKDRIAQERATRDIEIARNAYEREREIGRRGLRNAREIQSAEADVRAAELDAQRARIASQAARAAQAGAGTAVANARSAYAALVGTGNRGRGGTLTLSAPIGGRVVHRGVSRGQAIERTTEMFEIDDLGAVHVTAQVPERLVAGIRRGTRVTVTTDAFPRRRFFGTVDNVGGRLDPKTRTLPVQCLVPNEDGALKPEMFAQVSLGRSGEVNAIVVPEAALFEDGGKSFVYVQETGGKFARTAVNLGRSGGEYIEIVSGLDEGAKVVTQGVFTLRSQSQKDELKGHED